jgi:hypothetical protein
MRSRNGARETLRIDSDLYKQIKTVGASQGATLFHTLLAAFEVLIFRLSGQQDLIVGIPIAGQSELENGHLVAHCVTTLPLRCQADPNATFAQFLKELRATYLHEPAFQVEDPARCRPPSADLGRVQHRPDWRGFRFRRSLS